MVASGADPASRSSQLKLAALTSEAAPACVRAENLRVDLAAAAASGHGKLLQGEPLAELEKTRPLSQEKFDEQYPANLLDELKGFDLVKYRAEREKVLRESHIKAIAFN